MIAENLIKKINLYDKEIISSDEIIKKISNNEYCKSLDWASFKLIDNRELVISYFVEFDGYVKYESGDYYTPSSLNLKTINISIDVKCLIIDEEEIDLCLLSDNLIKDLKKEILSLYDIVN